VKKDIALSIAQVPGGSECRAMEKFSFDTDYFWRPERIFVVFIYRFGSFFLCNFFFSVFLLLISWREALYMILRDCEMLGVSKF
jgi:hypothetical protein